MALSSTLGNVVEVLDRASGASLVKIGRLSAPSDALLLADGSLLYSEFGTGQISRASGPTFTRREVVASGLSGPVQMLQSRSGALYVTEASGSLKLVSLTGSAKPRDILSNLIGPEGLAETPQGTLIIAEVGRRRLIEVDPTTKETWIVADNLPIGLDVKSSMPRYSLPTGVAVDVDGSIYVSADKDNGIYQFKPCR
jgi:glucose/arabinose dehydrogenase